MMPMLLGNGSVIGTMGPSSIHAKSMPRASTCRSTACASKKGASKHEVTETRGGGAVSALQQARAVPTSNTFHMQCLSSMLGTWVMLCTAPSWPSPHFACRHKHAGDSENSIELLPPSTSEGRREVVATCQSADATREPHGERQHATTRHPRTTCEGVRHRHEFTQLLYLLNLRARRVADGRTRTRVRWKRRPESGA